MSAEETVRCDVHGNRRQTFVCRHLAEDPVQEWFGEYPSEGKAWPDAWCAKCDASFQREGEWNERNEADLEIRILCDACYSGGRCRSVERLRGAELDQWQEFVSACCEETSARQERFVEEFALGEHKRWDWSQDTGQLVFSNDGVPAVICDIEFVGSTSTKSGTWLWSWANFSFSENVRTRMMQVRDLGEKLGYPHLATPQWFGGKEEGSHMTSVAAHVLGAAGVYRSSDEDGTTFLVILRASRVS